MLEKPALDIGALMESKISVLKMSATRVVINAASKILGRAV